MMMWQYLAYFIGTPYIYGGNSPIYGVDCSALVAEGLRSRGHLGKADHTASSLAALLKSNGWAEIGRDGISPDDVLFFGPNPNLINHVAIAVDQETMIEAGGGDASTKTVDDAIAQQAMVRVRPIKWRKDFLFALYKGN